MISSLPSCCPSKYMLSTVLAVSCPTSRLRSILLLRSRLTDVTLLTSEYTGELRRPTGRTTRRLSSLRFCKLPGKGGMQEHEQHYVELTVYAAYTMRSAQEHW